LVDHVSERLAPPDVSDQLHAILDAIDSGVVVQDADLRLRYVNRAGALASGWASPQEMLEASVGAAVARFDMIDERGDPLPPSALPGRRVLAGEGVEPVVIGFRSPDTGAERWALVRASP
jgi:PAS domain-containing protein